MGAEPADNAGCTQEAALRSHGAVAARRKALGHTHLEAADRSHAMAACSRRDCRTRLEVDHSPAPAVAVRNHAAVAARSHMRVAAGSQAGSQARAAGSRAREDVHIQAAADHTDNQVHAAGHRDSHISEEADLLVRRERRVYVSQQARALGHAGGEIWTAKHVLQIAAALCKDHREKPHVVAG